MCYHEQSSKLGVLCSQNDQECTIIKFVKAHPELYTKENAHYVDQEGRFIERAWWTVRKDRSRDQKIV